MPLVQPAETELEPAYCSLLHVLPMNRSPKLLEMLVWAAIPPGPAAPRIAWCGVGCTSNHGFPIDYLAMPMAGLALGLVSQESPFINLVADHHARLAACSADEATRRGHERRADLFRIGRAMRMPTEIVLASEIMRDNLYCEILDRVKMEMQVVNDAQKNDYNVQAVADAVFMAAAGRIKVGWTRYPQAKLIEGKGGSDEYNGTDRFAKQITPDFCAAYVRHGVTTDSTHPTGVPYSVRDGTASRLMLTGVDCGGFHRKIELASARRRVELIAQVERIVASWEELIGPLSCTDPISKAEQIVAIVNQA